MTTLELVKILNQQANEIASEGHNGWSNTVRDAADKLEELQERIYQLENQCAKSAYAHALAEERSDDSQQRVVGGDSVGKGVM